MLEQPGDLRWDLPLALGRQTQLLHQCPNRVDLLGELVLLVAIRKPLGPELQLSLLVLAPPRFLGLGIGVISCDFRRPSNSTCVGMPFTSSQWRLGRSYGELRIGSSKKRSLIAAPLSGLAGGTGRSPEAPDATGQDPPNQHCRSRGPYAAAGSSHSALFYGSQAANAMGSPSALLQTYAAFA